MSKLKDRKAISPVIATVILVAVAITIAVAVAYWMGGISSQYTKFEKVEVQSGVCTYNTTDTSWKLTLKLKNTGTATATLNSAFINDVEIAHYNLNLASPSSTSTNMTTSTQILSGASKSVNIYVDNGYASLSSGTTVNLKIHSAGGMDYIKLIELV